MSNLFGLFTNLFYRGSWAKIGINPDGSGLWINDGQISITWNEIRELQEDPWLKNFSNWWHKYSVIVTDAGTFRTHPFSDDLRSLIIKNSNLKNKKFSFLRSKEIFYK